MNKLLTILLIFSLGGCSNKAVYEKLHQDERNKCAKEQPLNYLECVERNSKSYKDYERERKELRKCDSRHQPCSSFKKTS